MRLPRAVVLSIVWSLVIAGCSSTETESAEGPSTSSVPARRPIILGTPAPLVRLNPSKLAHCRRSRRLRPICPRLVPRVRATYLSHLSNGRTYSLFDLERGLPGRPPPSGAHITIAAGHVEQVDPFVHPTAADPVATLDDARLLRNRREPVSFGRVTWGGRTGILFLAPPYLFGGQLGDHLVFAWREGDETYLYSLHSWRPVADTAATLRTMVRSIG